MVEGIDARTSEKRRAYREMLVYLGSLEDEIMKSTEAEITITMKTGDLILITKEISSSKRF